VPDVTFRLILVTGDTNAKLAEVKQEAQSTQSVVEKPAAVKISAEKTLATIRDVKIAVGSVNEVVGTWVCTLNSLLYAAITHQRQAMTVTLVAIFLKGSIEQVYVPKLPANYRRYRRLNTKGISWGSITCYF